MMNFKEIENKLKKYDSMHLLKYYDELSNDEKNNLLSELENIDFEFLNSLYRKSDNPDDINKKIEEIPYVSSCDISREEKEKYINIGIEAIKNNKIAVCQMAGGQGTRLGCSGPKGKFIVNLKAPKSIFEIFADKLKETYTNYGVKVKWYVMTSKNNDSETKSFFEDNDYFGYGKENIKFFVQGEMPLLNLNGKVVLSEKGKLLTAANGNGGIYEALHKKGILEELKKNNITYLGIGNVDNILLDILDPLFIGMMVARDEELGIKTVTKTSPEEKVGVICKLNGKPGVVEYTEITDEMANLRDEAGRLVFGEAYYGLAVFKVELLEKIVEGLSYHVNIKKNSYLDESGNMVEPASPNTYKFEMFIFEGFNYAKNMLALSVKREENFAPIKNKDGVDSPETAIKLYNDYYKL